MWASGPSFVHDHLSASRDSRCNGTPLRSVSSDRCVRVKQLIVDIQTRKYGKHCAQQECTNVTPHFAVCKHNSELVSWHRDYHLITTVKRPSTGVYIRSWYTKQNSCHAPYMRHLVVALRPCNYYYLAKTIGSWFSVISSRYFVLQRASIDRNVQAYYYTQGMLMYIVLCKPQGITISSQMCNIQMPTSTLLPPSSLFPFYFVIPIVFSIFYIHFYSDHIFLYCMLHFYSLWYCISACSLTLSAIHFYCISTIMELITIDLS